MKNTFDKYGKFAELEPVPAGLQLECVENPRIDLQFLQEIKRLQMR